MATIIKNQILKHLSKFTKNLSPDKINVSTLKGEGELHHLELDELILMELLDLPTWMKLTKAICNRVSIKIQWTKLKSQPICIYLDEVVLEVETCETPRPPNSPAHQASYRSGGKYGFVDRVIDGIYVHINSVSVMFLSKKFHASLQLTRVKIHSVAPNWKPCADLGPTKIRDSERGEILLFKEVDWQTTRIEATAVEGENSEEFTSIPLRFIANQSKVRITMKKRLSDCGIIASRLTFLLDDLLWVLTDTQLKAAILYINSLRDLMKKSREQSKNLAAEKLHIQGQSVGYSEQSSSSQQSRSRSQSNAKISALFSRYDVQTTTYHVISSRIDLHLCDDSQPDSVNHPGHNKQVEGGAMQVTINKLSVDIYPYNRAGGERKQWYRYTDNQGSRNLWVQQLFMAFKNDVTKARETLQMSSPSQSPAHKAQSKSAANQNEVSSHPPPRPPPPSSHPTTSSNQSRRPRSTKLLESCYVLKVEDFTIFQVSTADNKRSTPKKFLTSDKKQLHLPADMSVIHAEYTDYFFPEGVDFPVPHANLYILINPTRLNVDWLTLLWINYFSLSLSQSIGAVNIEDTVVEHVDIKLEAIMPRVLVPSEEKVENQPDRPDGIQLQASRLSATNTRVELDTKGEDLADLIDMYSCADLFSSGSFPNDTNKIQAIPNNFSAHASGIVNPYIEKLAKKLVEGIMCEGNTEEMQQVWKTNTLKQDAKYDIWFVKAEQVWLDFIDNTNYRGRPQPFVDSIPLTLWICKTFQEDKFISESTNTVDRNFGKVMDKEEVKKKPLRRLYNSVEEGGRESQDDKDREERHTRKLLKTFYNDEKKDNSDIDSSQTTGSQNVCDNYESGAKSSSPVEGKNDQEIHPLSEEKETGGEVQYYGCQTAQLNLLAKVGSKRVKAQLTHYQYLFLMRLLDSFTNFQSQMNADVEYFVGEVTSTFSFSIPLLVQEFEVVIVSAEEYAAFDLGSPSVTSTKDEIETDTTMITIEQKDIQMNDIQSHSAGEDDRDRSHSVLELLPPTQTHISKSQSDSGICHSPLAQAVENQLHGKENGFHPTISSHSARALDVESDPHAHRLLGVSNNMGSDSGISTNSDMSRQIPRKTANKAVDQMSKFKSKMSGFADKIKAKMEIGDDNLDLDDYDNISIRTDISDDDLDFELLSLEEDGPAFHHQRDSETNSVSTDIDAIDDLSSYTESSSAIKGKEQVSLIAFKLSGIELLLSGDGTDTCIGIQALRLQTNQMKGVTFEEFQRKFASSVCLCSEDDAPVLSSTHTVKMKFASSTSLPTTMNEGPSDTLTPSNGTPASLHVTAADFGMKFSMSSLTQLTSFIEDEVAAENPLPMNVQVQDFSLILQDDSPLPSGSIAPEPLKLEIHKLGINRGIDRIFHLIGRDPRSLDNTEVLKEMKILRVQNKSLSDKLTSAELKLSRLEEVEEENKSLRTQLKKFADYNMAEDENASELTKENLKLQQKLADMEDEVNSLTKEKASLVSTLKLLQDDLDASERRRRTDSQS